jgi:Lrp/AsnC family leucine-responsive transcriptional regulator
LKGRFMTLELDIYDLKLLALVQEDSRISQSELGERVSLSTAAVNRRLKRLVGAGVIQRFGAVLSPEQLGHPLTIIALVETESERIDLLDAMKRSFAECPQVQQCYYVTGEWDFVLIFVVPAMSEYTALTRQLFFKSNNVKRFKSLVSMDSAKTSLSVPIALDIKALPSPDVAGS